MKYRSSMIAIAIAAGFTVSCAGAPPPVEAPPVKAPAVEAPSAESSSAALDERMAAAKDRRAYIRQHGLENYAPEPFAQAEEHFAAAETAYSSDPKTAEGRIDSALPLYEQTVRDGFAKKIDEKRAAADSGRAAADAEKAKVAAKEDYEAAEADYAKAKEEQAAARFPESANAYEKSAAGFAKAAKTAAERRETARAAMDKADASIKSTTERMDAIDAEIKTQDGGEQ